MDENNCEMNHFEQNNSFHNYFHQTFLLLRVHSFYLEIAVDHEQCKEELTLVFVNTLNLTISAKQN